MTGLKRFLPATLLAAGLVAIIALDLDRFLSLAALREHRHLLTAWVDARPLAAGLAYCALYALAVACSLPGATALTLFGGFLFGTALGSTLAVVGATLGASMLFLAARSALGDSLRQRAGPWFAKLEAGFREGAISYLLVLRLVPLFPFFIVNLVPAFFGVRLRDYVWTTALGIVPGAVVYSSVGAGLGAVLDAADTPIRGLLRSPPILLPLLGLALLALLPLVYRRWRARKR